MNGLKLCGCLYALHFCNNRLLEVPKARLIMGGRFSVAGLKLWNMVFLSIRQSPSISYNSFKTELKTFLN